MVVLGKGWVKGRVGWGRERVILLLYFWQKCKKLKSHEKPLKRLLKNTKPLKIKHLMNFVSVFQFY
jgi:hypothetical protein